MLDTQEVPRFTAHFAQLTEALGRWRAEGFTVRLVAGDEHQAEHLRQILRDNNVEAPIVASLDAPESPAIVVGECSAGIAISAVGLVLLTEAEIFGARRRTLRRPKYQRGAALTAFTDLEVGDLVVHEDHGIGRYLGLRTMSVGDRDGDFLLLEYAEGGRLYVPVERLDLVSKYLGGDAGTAKLDRMGGASWQRVKESVRAALREMAEGLLKLYAQRAVAEGHPFATDTPWQREFEAAFRFEETPDQLRAIEEVKRDMENRAAHGPPGGRRRRLRQDRGRAARRVQGGGATATRSPCSCRPPCSRSSTGPPSPIGSRPFRPRSSCSRASARRRSRRRWWRGCARARWTSSSAPIACCPRTSQFKTSGLLIIDEEHRFGVAHKERMKQLRASVDVLALTATPIPRTLYMALSGVRDMSVIETPPLDRLPIETVVRRFSKAVIKEALERELERGGQVFFVHNRVQSLTSMTRFIQELVPEARVDHGPRPDERARAGSHHGPVRQRPGRRPGLDRHRRVGPRHPGLEHDHHQPRRPVRPGPALPAARTGGARAAAGVTAIFWSRPTAGWTSRPSGGCGRCRS